MLKPSALLCAIAGLLMSQSAAPVPRTTAAHRPPTQPGPANTRIQRHSTNDQATLTQAQAKRDRKAARALAGQVKAQATLKATQQSRAWRTGNVQF